MTSVVYDYSFARPDPTALGDGVMRYLAPCGSFAWPEHSVGKVVGLDELQALWAAGKRVGLVWEVDTWDFQRGYDGGFAWGQQARQMATTLGIVNEPIFCAVDRRLTDDQRALAVEYVRGFHDGANAGRPYGEGALIDQCVAVYQSGKGWMPDTWGNDTTNVCLVQTTSARPGVTLIEGTDANIVTDPDWGGFHPGDVPDPEPPTEDITWLFPML